MVSRRGEEQPLSNHSSFQHPPFQIVGWNATLSRDLLNNLTPPLQRYSETSKRQERKVAAETSKRQESCWQNSSELELSLSLVVSNSSKSLESSRSSKSFDSLRRRQQASRSSSSISSHSRSQRILAAFLWHSPHCLPHSRLLRSKQNHLHRKAGLFEYIASIESALSLRTSKRSAKIYSLTKISRCHVVGSSSSYSYQGSESPLRTDSGVSRPESPGMTPEGGLFVLKLALRHEVLLEIARSDLKAPKVPFNGCLVWWDRIGEMSGSRMKRVVASWNEPDRALAKYCDFAQRKLWWTTKCSSSESAQTVSIETLPFDYRPAYLTLSLEEPFLVLEVFILIVVGEDDNNESRGVILLNRLGVVTAETEISGAFFVVEVTADSFVPAFTHVQTRDVSETYYHRLSTYIESKNTITLSIFRNANKPYQHSPLFRHHYHTSQKISSMRSLNFAQTKRTRSHRIYYFRLSILVDRRNIINHTDNTATSFGRKSGKVVSKDETRSKVDKTSHSDIPSQGRMLKIFPYLSMAILEPAPTMKAQKKKAEGANDKQEPNRAMRKTSAGTLMLSFPKDVNILCQLFKSWIGDRRKEVGGRKETTP
ncbi:hypothetical protein KCU65_g32, partial [Aureobasidium melanogenum]